MKILHKLFLWLGNGLFGKYYFIDDDNGITKVIMWARCERDANCAVREWVEALDNGAKWSSND